jgi:hypothetical protein
MQLRHFVSASAVVLTGWLAVTFVYEVPSQRYPKLDKYPTTAVSPEKTAPGAPVIVPVSAVVQVSGSH